MVGFAVIQGSSRGIGLHLARQLLTKSSLDIVALSSRPPSQSKDQILSSDGSPKLDDSQIKRLHTFQMDATDEGQIKEAAKNVRDRFGNQLRMLLNVSGVLYPDKSVQQIDHDELLRSFQLNTFAHILTFKHFVPLLASKVDSNIKRQNDEEDSSFLPENLSILASLTARVGSIGDNERGGWIAYRASKAATNQAIVTLNHELSRKANSPAIAVALHPGTVAGTDISRGFVKQDQIGQNGIHTPDVAATLLLNVLSSLRPDQGGQFLDYDGKPIKW